MEIKTTAADQKLKTFSDTFSHKTHDSATFLKKQRQSNKVVRSEVKELEKVRIGETELSQKLVQRLNRDLERKFRPEVRQIYLLYLKELNTLLKQQDLLKVKYVSRLDLYRNLGAENELYRYLIRMWLREYGLLHIIMNAIIEIYLDFLEDGDTEFQFLLMAIICKFTQLIISILKRYHMTLSFLLDSLVTQLGPRPDSSRAFEALDRLGEQLAGKSDGNSDADAFKNLDNAMENFSDLYSYIDMEREKRIKYLPNLQVNVSNLISQDFFTLLNYKRKVLYENGRLALNKQPAQIKELKCLYVYLDVTQRNEVALITDMVELSGFIVRRLILFPILEQKEVLRKICSVCLYEEDSHLWLCAACVGVTYCGRQCQEEDWPRHEAICGSSRLDNIKRSQRIKFQTVDEFAEHQVKGRVSQFYGNQ